MFTPSKRVWVIIMSFSISQVVLASSRRSGCYSSRTRSSAFALHHALERRRPFASFLAAANNNNNNDNNEANLEHLRRKIIETNGGVPINVQSPKQVSTAVFGAPQAANKSVLQEAASSQSALSQEKRMLAQLILEYRSLLQFQKRNASTASAVEIEDEEDEDEEAPRVSSKSTTRNKHTKVQTSHEQLVESLFASPGSKLDPYWREPLLQLSKSTSRNLVKQLDPDLCPMGYNPNATPNSRGGTSSASSLSSQSRRGTFISYYREQKELYPQCVVLIRCGDFYECYGLDAILLVEHVGLNSMAGKARAGCPYRNVQATVDGLTQQGFSVAVYEEVGAVASNKLKSRLLAQIVSPASPTYLYDNWLLGSEHGALESLPPSRPCVGIVHTAAGYNLVEVSLEERSIEYSERMTPEAVACRLAAYPPADPVVYIPSAEEESHLDSRSLPFLPNTRTSTSGDLSESSLGGFRIRTKVLSPKLIPEPVTGVSDADRYIQSVLETLLQLNERRSGDEESSERVNPPKRPTKDDFFITMKSNATNPLYVETATQLGLLKNPSIPSLTRYILDESAPAATRRFLQRYLLVPPPPLVAQAMASLVEKLMREECSLPPLIVTPLGKVLSLIRAGQASANIYGDLVQSLSTTIFVLDDEKALPIDSLLVLCAHESGLPAEQISLVQRCQQAVAIIEAVINPAYHAGNIHEHHDDYDPMTEHRILPREFFERNESPWRGRVQPSMAVKAYERVQETAIRLCKAVEEDFIGDDKNNQSLLVHDKFNNLIALKRIPNTREPPPREYFFHPRDRNGKTLRNKYTTVAVEQALSDYKIACDSACDAVSKILTDLATTLQDEGHIPAIVQSGHLNLALSAAFHHAVKATQLRWHLAETVEPVGGENNEPARLVNLWPYWMPRSQAVTNTFDLDGLFLLTAPNMSGKSTLMRSTAAAALLTVCGLCAPLEEGSRIPRFDTLFLRGASADVPAEDKSAFGAEMGDIAALMRCCGSRSLVFVDELGRGTSPRDGTRLAGAVLEAMAKREMNGIFATHLHDMLELPLKRKDRILTKRMAIEESDDGNYEWTYRMEDGTCTNSLALVTAARFGLPEEIIRRAEELADFLPDRIWSNYSEPEQDISNSDVGNDAALPPIMQSQQNGKKEEYERDFVRATTLAEELTGQSSITIPPKWNPPASFGNKSCVYILELANDPPRYYVGETDSLSRRLQQHRRRGVAWSRCRAVALPVPSKTEARAFESMLIQKLAQSGYSMESVADGRSIRQL